MGKPVLVLGALSPIGTAVVKSLLERGFAVRAADRNLEKIREEFGTTVEIVAFDYTNPFTWPETFNGIDKMFLMRPPHIAKIKKVIIPALDVALAANVRSVVFLSATGIEQNSAGTYAKIEEYLRRSGQTWTFLRCSFFMQDLNTIYRNEIKNEDSIFVPLGDSKISFIDTRDVGAVAALCLSESGHKSKTYHLTGAQALNYCVVSSMLTQELGRIITYRSPSTLAFFFRQLRNKMPIGPAWVTTWLYIKTKWGKADYLSQDVFRLLGRPAISMHQYIEDYKNAWLR